MLPLLVSPIILVLLILAYAVIRQSRKAVIFVIVLLCIASTPIFGERIFRSLEQHQVRLQPQDVDAADATVVLSGMLKSVEGKNGNITEWAGGVDRFFGGIELYESGKTPLLIFTGGLLPWQTGQEPEGELLRRFAMRMGVSGDAVRVSESAQNTQQESLAVKKLLGEKMKNIILVTSAFHMPRAQKLFEQAGFKVTPYPVDFGVTVQDVRPMDFLPSAGALAMTDAAVREWLGRVYYWLREYSTP